MPRLFVYGTLKRGECNHTLLARLGAQFLGEARTVRPYGLYEIEGEAYRHPAMAQTRGPSPVQGELYDVERFRPVDQLERHPAYYVRRRVVVKQGARRIRVWTYFIQWEYLREQKRHGRVLRPLAGIWRTAAKSGADG